MKLRTVRRSGKTAFMLDYYEGGRRVRRIPKGVTDRRTAALVAKEFEVNRERGAYGFPNLSCPPLAEACNRYVEMKAGGNAPSWRDRRDDFKQAIVRHLGADTPLRKIARERVERYKSERVKEVTPTTVNMEIGFLRAVMDLAVELGWLTELPFKRLTKLPEESRTVRFLSEDEIESLFAAAERYRGLREKVVFLLNTGLRRGEMFRLKWSDIDFAHGVIRVLSRKRGSSSKMREREIPMNDTLRTLLESMPRKGEHPFPHECNLRRKLQKACVRAGIEPFGVHTLRHTFASHLVIRGVPLYTVSQLLGHSSVNTTQIYAHLSPGHLRGAVDVIGFGSEKPPAQVVSISEASG